MQVGTGCECNTALGWYYDTVNLICDTCGNIYSNCTACTGSGYSSTCTACAIGTYLDGNSICQICPNYTTACLSATVATACETTFTLRLGQCVCDANYQLFLDTVAGNCTSCSSFYSQCTSCASTNLTTSGV